MAKTVLRTPICDLLGIEYPVVLAGMGPTAGGGRAVASPELVAAVSNAGGLGVLGGAGASPDALRAAIRRVRELTDRPFGVDILLPSNVYRAPSGNGGARPDPAAIKAQIPEEYRRAVRELKAEFNLPDVEAPPPSGRGMGLGPDLAEAQVQVIFQERVPVLAVGLGNPAPYVPQARELGIKVIALVGNVKNARRVAEAGVDIVVAQGTEAGGHTGRVGTMALVPQVVDAVRPVPVLAAGGIGDGRGLAAALCLGAQGAWVGIAFIPTK
ncbi:MAG TPA: nitronate monooxygenase, partial [Dehalococcoidia bacterium]